MKQIPIHLISGFLGSGKTTFLKNFLLADTKGIKMAVVQNEFAPGNTDGQTLKREVNKEFDLLEFNNGSIFCVCLLSGFISGLDKFIEKHRPDIILIETSGMSDPIAVGEIFNGDINRQYYLASITSIVDAVNFLKVHQNIPQIKNQLMIAHKIIINKTDLSIDTVKIKNYIRQINPSSDIFETTFCQIPFDQFIKELLEKRESKNIPKILPINTGNSHIRSAILKTSKSIAKNHVKDFLISLQKESYRVKGFIISSNGEIVSVQCVGDQYSIKSISSTIKKTELIAIGENMTVKKLKRIYMSYYQAV